MLKNLATRFVVLITILSIAVVSPAHACTRLVYQGGTNGPITARSMDWLSFPGTELWVFPKGMKRDGGTDCNPIRWTSKYGSIVTSSYDFGTVDGMNEEGLVTNLLFLTETDYGHIEPEETSLSIGAWGQYVLDNYATVNEAVTALEEEPFRIITGTVLDLLRLKFPNFPIQKLKKSGTMKFSLHMSLSDASGDSAIFEYIDGKLNIHHDKEYEVLTNDPLFDQQLAINSYWDALYSNLENDMVSSGFLPGTTSPSDRFVRASYYLAKMNSNQISELQKNRRNELAAALGIIRNVSNPLGLSGFNVATTQWRTVADQDKTNLTYFFEYTKSPNIFWVEMSKLNLEEGAPVMNLKDLDSLSLVGEVSNKFEEADTFSWDLSSIPEICYQ